MAKYCLEGNDPYGVLDWAVEAYEKWKSDGRPECVDHEILNYYIVSSSVYTGENCTNKNVIWKCYYFKIKTKFTN